LKLSEFKTVGEPIGELKKANIAWELILIRFLLKGTCPLLDHWIKLSSSILYIVLRYLISCKRDRSRDNVVGIATGYGLGD
jgi:hypothetical protein